MADWKKTNFEALEDRSPADVSMRWLFARQELGSPELGVSRFVYEPGVRMPFAHRHREQEEAYVVVGGSGRANLDGEIVALGVWDVLRVAPAVVRSFEAGPEGLDLICIGGRRPDGGDGEPAPDPWEAEGAGLRVEPVTEDSLQERDGRLVIPAAGAAIDDELVRALRDAGQR